jgi:autotransporter-associated beta strand protein
VLSGGSLSLNGALTTSQGLTKGGTGTLILGADNSATMTGDVVVNSGLLSFSNDNQLGNSANALTPSATPPWSTRVRRRRSLAA